MPGKGVFLFYFEFFRQHFSESQITKMSYFVPQTILVIHLIILLFYFEYFVTTWRFLQRNFSILNHIVFPSPFDNEKGWQGDYPCHPSGVCKVI